MTAVSLFDRWDDRLNPILVKELRQSVKNRVVIGILSFFLLFQLLMLVIGISNGVSDQGLWSGGRRIFLTQQMLLVFTIITALPAYSGARMLAERTDPGGDLMFLTSLKPSSIIMGKLLASLTIGFLVFSVCAPFMTLAYLLRGIDLLTIFVILGFDLVLMVLTTQFSLFVALLPGGLAIKRLAGGAGFFGLLFFGYMVMWVLSMPVERGANELFLIFPILIPVFAFFGYFYCYSIALVSPPSSNAMFSVRIYLTIAVFCIWLIFAGIALYLPAFLGRALPPPEFLPNIFAYPIGIFLCLQLVISTCERDHWGPRITRSIPSFFPLRMLAFLFYSGSVGGIIHTVFLILMTFGLALSFGVFITPSRPFDPNSLNPLAIMVLYTYCFSITGGVFRHYFLSKKIKPENTWVITAILVGLFSAVPNILAYIILGDRASSQEYAWWNLPNPFYYFFSRNWMYTSGRYGNEEAVFAFLGLWTALITLAAVPLAFEQFRRFTSTGSVATTRREQANIEMAGGS